MRQALIVCFLVLITASAAGAETFYIDCVSGSDSAPGTAEETAWRTIEKVSATTFAPGDSILFRRGTRCFGSLWPKGSGEEGRPIRIGAYAEGPLPVIDAGSGQAAIQLLNQQYWELEDTETTGGEHYGVYIGATAGTRTLSHYRIRNIVVHDVAGALKEKASGLVVISGDRGATMEDIVIDGVTAYNTTQWAGVYVSGARDVVVSNSVVHDTYGDGIVIFSTENGVIEKSAVWLTGLQPTETIGTPNGIWTWNCRNCVVQQTEGFWIDSPGVDGGVYDIDWGNEDNIVEYNYGHDAQGYCAAVFGAGKRATQNSIVRYNVCANNGRSPKLARRQGDLYTLTWDGGSLDGVLIYNNTFFWNPPVDAPPFHLMGTDFTGSLPNGVFNNLIYSNVPSMVASNGRVKLQYNLYWYPGDSAPRWSESGSEHAGFADYHATAPDERFGDPKIDLLLRPQNGSPAINSGVRIADAGVHDAFGTVLSPGSNPDIGAIQSEGTQVPQRKAPAGLPRQRNKWMLLLFAGRADAEARSQLVFMQAALAQYGDKSLEAGIIADDAKNLKYDWSFSAVKSIKAEKLETAMAIRKTPTLLLISPNGTIVRRWEKFAAPAELGLTLKRYLGPATGDPPLNIWMQRGGQ